MLDQDLWCEERKCRAYSRDGQHGQAGCGDVQVQSDFGRGLLDDGMETFGRRAADGP